MVERITNIKELNYFIYINATIPEFFDIYIITAIGILYKRYEAKYFPDEELDKYSLVRKYLLNESESMTGKEILYGYIQNMI